MRDRGRETEGERGRERERERESERERETQSEEEKDERIWDSVQTPLLFRNPIYRGGDPVNGNKPYLLPANASISSKKIREGAAALALLNNV